MPSDNPLRSLLDTLNSVTKVYNQKEQDQAAQAQMRKSTPSPMMGQQGPAMDQNNMAPAAALAAPWKPQQTPEYGALQQQIEAPQSPAMGPPAPGGVRDALGVPGMIQKGNIDLNQRPIVYNDDGSYSTVRSMGAKVGGRETLFPTVSDDGRIMGDREAIDTAGRTGRNLGVFKDAASSSAYGRSLHEDQAGQYEKQYREARPTVGPPNPYRGYESKQAFDARQGPNYSGDAVEGGQLSPVDLMTGGLGGASALGGPIRAAERAAEREAAPAMELSAEALRQNVREPVAKTLDRLGASKIWERPAAKATARAAQIQNALRDALEAAAKHIQESEAKTGVGRLGVQDGSAQILKLLETLKGK